MPTAEPILHADENRFVLFPVRYPTLWKAYKEAQKCFWTSEEIDFSSDLSDWEGVLTAQERNFLSTILAFFASSDGIVAENLVQQFCAEVQAPEARCFYGFQMMMENVHAETYARFLQELIQDETELDRLFRAIDTIPAVSRKAEWCLKWFDRSMYTFGTRVIAFAIVEGVFFSSSFAALLWIRTRGILPGLCQSNAFIMCDEGLHMEFACKLYAELNETISKDIVYAMVSEAVELEQSFFYDALPTELAGLNSALMNQYVEYVADFLLWRLNLPALYNRANPFPFMEGASIPTKPNFFESLVTEYLGSAV